MNFIKLTKDNYKEFLPIEHIVAFSYAEPGAMGCPGEVWIVTKSSNLYCFNIFYGNPTLSQNDINEIMPLLQMCNFGLFGNDKLPNGYYGFYMGVGNHLVIQHSILEKFNHLTKDIINSPALYSVWCDVVLKILHQQNQPTTLTPFCYEVASIEMGNDGLRPTIPQNIIGAIIGDIVGSRYEHYPAPVDMDFELFTPENRYTDDTVMTTAVADWLLHNRNLETCLQEWAKKHPHRGYGGKFREWLKMSKPQPYQSFGNGSGMRVSPIGFFANSLEETYELAKLSAEVTHNHPEGIKGAQSIASAIYLARIGQTKEQIREYIEQTFGYNLHRTCDEIRPTYHFDVTCQGSCPEAIIAFLDSSNYESSIRLSVSLGGDSDTIACMTGGIAAAYYGVPDQLIERAKGYLTDDILKILYEFDYK